MSLHFQTIAELRHLLETNEISSVELTEHFLKRIDTLDKNYNSFITVTADSALHEAKLADQRRANGNAGRLTGIPIAQKDIFCTEGIRTSCGSKMLDNFIAPYDAAIIESFKAEGMVMLGKTNMDEFAMGSSNETSFYGAVRNPWDKERVPGGSSGGSTAAVAAGLAPCSTGTDTRGSIRQPASYCNLTGLKPTYGNVSRYGMIAFASSLDQAGPVARTAEDCAYLMNIMGGFDERDSTSIERPAQNYLETLNNSLKGKKIGLPKEFFSNDLDPAVHELTMNVAKAYESLGATLHEISLPNISLALPAYYVVAPAEASSNLARYDGVRYGYRSQHANNLEELYKRSRGEGFGAEVKRRILMGTYVLSSESFDAYYLKAQKVRHLIGNDFQEAFKQVDVILSPSVPSTAFKIAEKADDPVAMYLSDLYTVGVNLAGLPGSSAPAGFINGLPLGFQLIGNHFSDPLLLNFIHQYQQMTDWHKKTPEGL
jgi:aspartyl-tRNA(Asn)/glutamyl-tRNA(Gln) amidotransferase subunit A